MTDIPPLTKGDKTRAAIIDASYALFLKHGFHGTSMRQIADKAGLALGGIYNYFDTKEEIFGAVLDAYHPYRKILPALEATQGETIEEFVRDGANRVREAIGDAGTKLMPLAFVEFVEFQGRHIGQLAKTMLPIWLIFAQRFSQKRGKLRRIPLPVMLRMFVGLFFMFIITEMVVKHLPMMSDTKYDWFDGMIDIYLHGIIQE